MASPAFRSKATGGGSTAANVTVSAPSGVQANDILVGCLSKDDTGAVTWPAGGTPWTMLEENTADGFYSGIGWRRASGLDVGSYTWTFTSTWRDCVVLAYSGCITSGVPFDPDVPTTFTTASVNTGNVTHATPSNVTATVDTRAVAFLTYIAVSGWGTVPTGYTYRQNTGGVEMAVADLAVAGTGTIAAATFNLAGSGGAAKGFQLALQSVSAATPSLVPPVRRPYRFTRRLY